MGKKGVAGKKVKSKQESAEVAPAEAQTAQDAPAACIKCGRKATRSYRCHFQADCHKQYAACDTCDLNDLVNKAANKKLEEPDRFFPCDTCVHGHIKKKRPLVIKHSNRQDFPMLREMSLAPAGAAPHAAGKARRVASHLAAAAARPRRGGASPGGERELPAAGRMDSLGASVGGDVASDGEGNAEAGAAAETAGSPSGQRVPEKEQQAPLEEEQQEAPSAAQEEEVRDVEYMRSRLREVGGEDSEAEVGGEDAEAEAEALAPRSPSAPPSQRPELQRQTKRNEISTEGRSTDAATTTSSTATSAATGASEERRAPGASEEHPHRETEPFADGFMETLPSVALYRNPLAQMEFEESVVTAQREAEEREEDRRWEAAQNHVCFRTQHCSYYNFGWGWCMRREFCSYIHAGPDEVRY